jgi:hypothetical protein
MASTRRLAAILAADVAGFSRLMGADEEGTHERLRRHLRDLVDSKIKEHRGRIVKKTGDGLLAEFSSVVDPVCCATEMQRAMADRNTDTVEDKRIAFRIGINLGDVTAEEDDIYGDGCQTALNRDPGSASNRNPFPALGQVCPGSEQEGPRAAERPSRVWRSAAREGPVCPPGQARVVVRRDA